MNIIEIVKKHYKKILAGVGIAVVLVIAFIFGDPTHEGPKTQNAEKVAATHPAQIATEAIPTPAAAELTEPPAGSQAPSGAVASESTPLPSPVAVIVTQEPYTPAASEQPPAAPVPKRHEVYVFDGEEKSVCTLCVRCDTLLDKLGSLDSAVAALVPANGVILSAREVSFSEGESVFDVTQRELERNGIHMEFSKTAGYNSAYIEGINNIYEFDAGELSGWEYTVNGVFPGYGCSQYKLKKGDRIEWRYTCDLGRDLK